MQIKKIVIGIIIGLLLLLVVGAFLARHSLQIETRKFGSVAASNEYYSTTTRNSVGTALASGTVLKAGPGAVGQVTIQAAAAGTIFLCDATTTNASLRNNKATSTLNCPFLLPVSAAAGTYTVDAGFDDGLLFLTTGTLGTSTITWR